MSAISETKEVHRWNYFCRMMFCCAYYVANSNSHNVAEAISTPMIFILLLFILVKFNLGTWLTIIDSNFHPSL